MPPPRLFRNLRPCHPSGSARQIRCASQAGRVKPLTGGRDAGQSTYPAGHESSTNLNVSEEGTQTPSAAQPPRRQYHVARQPTCTEVAGEALPEADAVAIRQQLQQLSDKVKALQTMLEAGSMEKRDSSNSVVSPVVSHKRNQSSYRDLLDSSRRRLQSSTHYLAHISNELETMSPHLRASLAPMVSSQLRAIGQGKHKASKSIIAHTSPTTAAVASTYSGSVPPAPVQSQNLAGGAFLTTVDLGEPAFRKVLSTDLAFRKYSHTIILARKIYCNSIYALIQAVHAVEALASPAASSIASRIQSRLRDLVEDARKSQDQRILRILEQYKSWETNVLNIHNIATRSEIFDSRPKLRKNKSLGLTTETPTPATTYEIPAALRQKLLSSRPPLAVHKAAVQGVSVNPLNTADLRAEQHGLAGNVGKQEADTDILAEAMKSKHASMTERRSDVQRLTRQIHTHSRSLSPSNQLKNDQTSTTRTTKSATKDKVTLASSDMAPLMIKASSNAISDQSLLDELFPEASKATERPRLETRNRYPKLDLPESTPLVRRQLVDRPISLKEQAAASFKRRGEQITVLQLVNCSTQLTEADFRRLIPKGKHIDAWRREGDFFKIIPGRDPLSLERSPFYYILFKNPESALAYQKNVSRLHKLSALHQPSNIFSAVPPPKGFLEDGEDIGSITSSYNLLPTHHKLSLSTVMQPYNPVLRALIERGGYQPIVPDTDKQGNRIWRVLMHIEGYEPLPSDLFKIFRRDAYKQGTLLTLRNEASSSIHRLRDLVNLKTKSKPISTISPRAYGTFDHASDKSRHPTEYEDPAIQAMMVGVEEDASGKEINQYIMNRVYNRWILDFEDGDAARRFAIHWHRRVLPDLPGTGGWKDSDEARLCNTEVLW